MNVEQNRGGGRGSRRCGLENGGSLLVYIRFDTGVGWWQQMLFVMLWFSGLTTRRICNSRITENFQCFGNRRRGFYGVTFCTKRDLGSGVGGKTDITLFGDRRNQCKS